jgi:hypothetical protein
MKKLFTERHGMTQPRVKEELDEQAAIGLLAIVRNRIEDNWYGFSFPLECEDGPIIGVNTTRMKNEIAAYSLIWPYDWPDQNDDVPTDAHVFDLVEFSYQYIALPEPYDYHSYYRHQHLNFSQEAGREGFSEDINRVFERHGIAFQLADGEVRRIAPTGLQEVLAETVFKSGDADLDRLLQTAREKFLNRSLEVRKEGLEKLWDAWERLKTVEPGRDKKAQITTLINRSSTELNFRKQIDDEGNLLTWIGNNFMIRHTGTNKTPINESAHVDYLFHRMFALIRLLLKQTNRGV